MNLYDALITDNPGICDNCFTRTHEIEEDWYPERVRQSVERILTPLHQQTHNAETVFIDSERQENDVSSACSRCGSIDRGIRLRPLSKQDMMELTHRLCNRLHEEDILYHQGELYDTVRELKEDPDNQFADDTIFRKALNQSVVINE